MKGWVYIITNKSMPNLIKVGYTMKDPAIRAKELNTTGVPHPYIVEYEMLTHNPYEIEQKVHNQLSKYREGKEWFNCPAEYAVQVINEVAGKDKIDETFKKSGLADKIPEIKKKLVHKREDLRRVERKTSSVVATLKRRQQKLNSELQAKVENEPERGGCISALILMPSPFVVLLSFDNGHGLLEQFPVYTACYYIAAAFAAWILFKEKLGFSKEDKLRNDSNFASELKEQIKNIGIEISEKEDEISEVQNSIKELPLVTFNKIELDKKAQYDRTIADLSKAIEINPLDTRAYHNRGNAWHSKGDYDRAIADYNKAIEIDPRNARAYHNRGGTWYSKGDYDRAIADFDKAIEIDPRYAGAYNNRGFAWYRKSNYDRAITDYSKAIEIDPQYAHAYYLRGVAWEFKGDRDRATADYNKAIEIDPKYSHD